MNQTSLELSPNVHTAFTTFVGNESYFALLLNLAEDAKLQHLPPLFRQKTSFQTSLNQLEGSLTLTKSCFIVLRRNKTLTFVTYMPYRANEKERACLLDTRHACMRELGEAHFVRCIICKEISEVTDHRSWAERDAAQLSQHAECDHDGNRGTDDTRANVRTVPLDLGYKKNKCRLCDRRMKNTMSPEASAALAHLHTPGAAVQMFVDIHTHTLELNFIKKDLAVPDVAATLPSDTPSFTFYRHPATQLLYFIFCSPDSAPVQERMVHTVAIPGLVNVHAEEHGVRVDCKVEIHDAEDLVFEIKNERLGKYRSMYLRSEFKGTESVYDNIEADKAFFEAVG